MKQERLFEDLSLQKLEDNRNVIDEYRNTVSSLANSKSDFKFHNSGSNHATIVITQIFRSAADNIKIFASDLSVSVSQNPEYITALDKYLSSGKKLQLLLEKLPTNKSSLAYDIISKRVNDNPNIEIKQIDSDGLQYFKKSFNNANYHFVIGDSQMYRLETNTDSFSSICSFNDIQTASKLVEVFNKVFTSAFTSVHEIYRDKNFSSVCSIVIPEFENINLEMIEHFSKHPEDLQKLDWRKFEKLLDVIFRNQGFYTELGPGSGDGGIDLRLIQKDSIGQILTLVQAKKYKKENPIRIEAVQALSSIVQRENANRGLFVTTSRYLPGVEKWVSEQPTTLILAKSEDVAKWCQSISLNKDNLR